MGKGVVCPFSSNYLFVISRRIEKEAVDKMIAHFVTAPFIFLSHCFSSLLAKRKQHQKQLLLVLLSIGFDFIY